jgi:hypothetical protein
MEKYAGQLMTDADAFILRRQVVPFLPAKPSHSEFLPDGVYLALLRVLNL